MPLLDRHILPALGRGQTSGGSCLALFVIGTWRFAFCIGSLRMMLTDYFAPVLTPP